MSGNIVVLNRGKQQILIFATDAIQNISNFDENITIITNSVYIHPVPYKSWSLVYELGSYVSRDTGSR